jgi:hypothetical protein
MTQQTPLRIIPALLLLISLLTMLLRANMPLHYAIDVGVHEGYGGDLPMLRGFNTAEYSEHGTYRWTRDGATIALPGMGTRPLLVALDFLPLAPDVAAAAPQHMLLRVGKHQLATPQVREQGTHVQVLIPSHMAEAGQVELVVHTDTFTPPDDPRELGTPLAHITITAPASAGLALPDWRATLLWMLNLGLLWLLLWQTIGHRTQLQTRGSCQSRQFRSKNLGAQAARLHWGGQVTRAPREFSDFDMALPQTPPVSGRTLSADIPLWLTGLVGLLVALAALLDPPRWAFGAEPTLRTLLLCGVLLLLLRGGLPWLAVRLAIPLDRRTLGWLLLLIVVAFGLRFGGRLYPESMHGDINFHTHRMVGATGIGNLYLLARNRGVDFPYPPAGYLTLAPVVLLDSDPRQALQLGAALLESMSAFLVYTLVACTLLAHGRARQKRYIPPGIIDQQPVFPRIPQRTALLAAALYVLTAAGIMTNWWSFATHIFTQAAALLLTTTLFLLASGTVQVGRSKDRAMLLFLLFSGVFLGHFGFFINTVLYGGLLVVLVCWLAWRGHAVARRLWMPLSVAYVGAGCFAFLFFYSAYLPLFLEHAQAAAEGGLAEVAQREPVSRAQLWRGVWHIGFHDHFGFFPLLLMPLGIWWLWKRSRSQAENLEDKEQATLSARWFRPGRVLFALMACSLLVSSLFAILPFITLSSQSTRWMMFSAWVMAVGAALAFRLLWFRGRSGRLVVLVMLGLTLWNTAVYWLGPLAWRIRPPEPF